MTRIDYQRALRLYITPQLGDRPVTGMIYQHAAKGRDRLLAQRLFEACVGVTRSRAHAEWRAYGTSH